MVSDYVGRGDCVQAERQRNSSDICPRCEEVRGAGVCPAPGSLTDFMILFNVTYILCFGSSCKRHHYGYWPPVVHERMVVFDGKNIDIEIAKKLPIPSRRQLF